VRGLDTTEPYSLVIWHHKKLVELPPLEASFRFDVDFPTYHAKG